MTTEATFEPLLTDRAVAEMLGIHAAHVRQLARSGALPARKIGRYWRFRRSWIERWLEANNAEAVSDRTVVATQGRKN